MALSYLHKVQQRALGILTSIIIMARLEQVLKGIKTAFFDACVKATRKSHLRGCSSRDDLDPHPADPGFSCHSHVSLGLTA